MTSILKQEDLSNKGLTPFERLQIARSQQRPYSLDIVKAICEDFVELHGDRRFGDDKAIIAGTARFHSIPVVVIGQQKGRDTKERRLRNFGMPKPEGYRKALRVMKLAEKFGRPVLTFIDTPGAYPGIDAEERGQAEAIAYNLREMSKLRIPIIVTVVGEGGSGGALAIGIGDHVLMLENAVYSVISPEGCAAILWKDAGQAERASNCLRLTAEDLEGLGIIDRIIPEPRGGAHLNISETLKAIDVALEQSLSAAMALPSEVRSKKRFEKLRVLGKWSGY